MQIIEVQGNVKRGVPSWLKIGPKTLVVGPNGSGKSTIVNIIELALTGRAGDIAGRDEVAREADVMGLATNGAAELEAMVRFDDGVVAAYRTSGSTAKAKKATGDRPTDRCTDDVLPLRTLRTEILRSPVTARKYLMGYIADGYTRDRVRKQLPENIRPLWDSLVDRASKDVSAADLLVQAVESAAEKMRGMNAEARGAAKAVNVMTGGQAPLTQSDIDKIQSEYDTVTRQLSALNQRIGAINGVSGVQSLIANHESVIAKCDEEWAQLAPRIEALEAKLPEGGVPPIVTHVIPVMEASAQEGRCLCCGTLINLSERVAQVKDRMQCITDHATALRNKEALVTRARNADNTIKALRAQLSAMNASSEALPALIAERDAIAATQSEIQRKLNDATSVRAAYERARQVEAASAEAERVAAQWGEAKTAFTALMADVLTDSLRSYVEKVQAHLPKGDVFDLRLRDGDREVVQFGLVRDGKLHTALSGAEWARVLAAMANVCAEKVPYACLIPEERAFDPDTLTLVMEALSGAKHQVVLTSPVRPARVPVGWTVIER